MPKILYAYQSPKTANQWLDSYLSNQTLAEDETVAIKSIHTYPESSKVSNLFTLGGSASHELVEYDWAVGAGVAFDYFDEAYCIVDPGSRAPEGWEKPFLVPISTSLVFPHAIPDLKRTQKIAARTSAISEGIEWSGHTFQTRPQDITLILGRVTKILAMKALGETHPDFTWRSEANQDVPFTEQEFLRFAITLDTHVEGQYLQSWSKS